MIELIEFLSHLKVLITLTKSTYSNGTNLIEFAWKPTVINFGQNWVLTSMIQTMLLILSSLHLTLPLMVDLSLSMAYLVIIRFSWTWRWRWRRIWFLYIYTLSIDCITKGLKLVEKLLKLSLGDRCVLSLWIYDGVIWRWQGGI